MALFKKGESIECSLDFMLHDSPKAIQEFLVQIKPILNSKPSDSWKLDLSKCRYIGPDAAVILYAMVLNAKLNEQKWEVRLPHEPPSLQAFCEFSGLNYRLFGNPAPCEDHPKSEVDSLRIHKKIDYHQTPYPFVRLVQKHLHISKDMEDYLATCLNEAIQNVQDHAKSPIGAVTCARFQTKASEIRIAIVDLGLGIFTTLNKAHPDTQNAVHALKRVIRGKFTAGSRVNNLGLGLSNLADIVRQFQGQFTIITSDALFILKPKDGTELYITTKFNFPGTGVFFTLPISDTMSVPK